MATVARCYWIRETRLATAFYSKLVWLEVIITLIMQSGIIFLFTKYSWSQFQYGGKDSKSRNPFSWKIITVICLLLSFFFHPGEKNEYYFSTQMLVSFTMYMEAVGMLPQLFILRNHQEVEVKTGHYMFCMAVSRFLRLIFWLLMWHASEASFFYLIIADLLHTILLSDFCYYYIKGARSNSILLQFNSP